MVNDIPPLVEAGKPGFIPPPPANNPFPGAAQAHWPPPASAPVWVQGPPSPSPCRTSGWPYPRYGMWSPYSPYNTPAASWGEFTPASPGPPTPAGPGAQEPALGQPIAASPYFNRAEGNASLHPEWPANAQLERTHSQDAPRDAFGGWALKRSFSAGPMGRPKSRSQSRAYYSEEYDSENLARRPKDWRPDYEARRTLIPRIQRPRSDVEEFKDPIRRTIHTTLAYNPTDPCVSYDLRYFPNPSVLTFPHLRRLYNHIDFAQLATNPPVHKMRLFHPLLPWYIDVEQHQENGVTVQDVIMQMHIELQTQISARHYFNEELGSSGRERIARAFERRTQGPEGEEERKKGIRRVDYLEDRVVFVGLVRARDGLWEMRMKAVP
ncbi:hypothetical protein C0995_013287 [Termitomyces sp. Mi166|nr:hypothetical protein C0995_013287 [Termitomyces sp. Mi166\